MTTPAIADDRGRCAEHPGLHDRTPECRRFMTLAFARALGIEDPDAEDHQIRCPKCHMAYVVPLSETPESLAAECGIGHHTDTIDGCPEDVKCYKTEGCPGIMRHDGEDYGSLGDGGSYDIYKCDVCGGTHYSPMAD